MKIDTIGDYKIELETGPIVNPGYRIYKASWQTHKNYRLVNNQRPRWKLISTWNTESEAREEVNRLQNTTK